MAGKYFVWDDFATSCFSMALLATNRHFCHAMPSALGPFIVPSSGIRLRTFPMSLIELLDRHADLVVDLFYYKCSIYEI
jgi:hypothetical protein